MALNEFSTVLKAREFVRKANPTAIPVPLGVYLTAAGATSREVADMEEGEAGMCFTLPDGTTEPASVPAGALGCGDGNVHLPANIGADAAEFIMVEFKDRETFQR